MRRLGLVAAYAELVGENITLRAVSFRDGPAKRAEGKRPIKEAAQSGEALRRDCV